MIEFIYDDDNFTLSNEGLYEFWIDKIIESEHKVLGDITYVFCDDEFLLAMNQQYLDHDTYTDIITFDYTEDDIISGEIFISIERVTENASEFKVDFINELHRVMAHGLLHLCSYKDKSEAESQLMRLKEEEKIKLFHVEQF